MDDQKTRIEFYRQRTFSEKMNVTFEFIRENWKAMLKYSFYLIMPICLVQTFATNTFFNVYIQALSNSFGSPQLGNSLGGFLINYGVMLFCILIGSAMMSGMIYAMMQTYATRDNKLQNLTLNDFKEQLVRNAWRILFVALFLIFVYLILMFAAVFLAVTVSRFSLFITMPLVFILLLCMIPLILVIPVYIFERNIQFFDAIKKAWKLGTATLWGMLGLIIVLYFITLVIQTITTMPWYLTLMIGSVFSLSTESMIAQSAIFKFITYILGLLQSYGMYLSMSIGIVGLAFQYFHAREKIEGVTVDSNITHFDEL